MSDHGARACPGASAPITPDAPAAADEISRLTVAYPAFRFGCQMVGRHGSCWVAERKNGLHPGLHTVITSDLGELHAALAAEGGDGYAR